MELAKHHRTRVGELAHRLLDRAVAAPALDTGLVRVGVVMSAWSDAAAIESFRSIKSWAVDRGICLASFILVENRPLNLNLDLNLDPDSSTPTTVLSGSNTFLDLGGIAEGLEHLEGKPDGPGCDVYLLCNDRLGFYEENHRSELARISKRELAIIAQRRIAVGRLWSWPDEYIFTGGLRSWLQSHLILIGTEIAQEVGLRALYAWRNDIAIELRSHGFFSPTGAIDSAFLERLYLGLFSEEYDALAHGWSWHAALPRSMSDSTLVTLKASTIVAERLISSELVCSNVSLVDTLAVGAFLAASDANLAAHQSPGVYRRPHAKERLRLLLNGAVGRDRPAGNQDSRH